VDVTGEVVRPVIVIWKKLTPAYDAVKHALFGRGAAAMIGPPAPLFAGLDVVIADPVVTEEPVVVGKISITGFCVVTNA
jgi:hypothetical protein